MASVTFRKRLSSERGAELVEFAMTIPIMLFVLLGLFDFGLLLQRYEVVTNAGREGARMASLATPYTDTEIANRVRSYITTSTGETNQNLTDNNFSATRTVEGCGGVAGPVIRINVHYEYDFQFLGNVAKMFGGSFGTVPLNTASRMRWEGTPAQAGCP
jgi:hypothetical protein